MLSQIILSIVMIVTPIAFWILMISASPKDHKTRIAAVLLVFAVIAMLAKMSNDAESKTCNCFPVQEEVANGS